MKTVAFAVLLVSLTACAAKRPDLPPEHVIGKYVFAGKGSVAKHPWDVKADLILERDGQYTLDLRVHIEDEDEHESSYGTYSVDGDRLILEPADNFDHDDLKEWRIEDNRLVPKLGWPARLALKGLKVAPVFVKAE